MIYCWNKTWHHSTTWFYHSPWKMNYSDKHVVVSVLNLDFKCVLKYLKLIVGLIAPCHKMWNHACEWATNGEATYVSYCPSIIWLLLCRMPSPIGCINVLKCCLLSWYSTFEHSLVSVEWRLYLQIFYISLPSPRAQ